LLWDRQGCCGGRGGGRPAPPRASRPLPRARPPAPSRGRGGRAPGRAGAPSRGLRMRSGGPRFRCPGGGCVFARWGWRVGEAEAAPALGKALALGWMRVCGAGAAPALALALRWGGRRFVRRGLGNQRGGQEGMRRGRAIVGGAGTGLQTTQKGVRPRFCRPVPTWPTQATQAQHTPKQARPGTQPGPSHPIPSQAGQQDSIKPGTRLCADHLLRRAQPPARGAQLPIQRRRALLQGRELAAHHLYWVRGSGRGRGRFRGVLRRLSPALKPTLHRFVLLLPNPQSPTRLAVQRCFTSTDGVFQTPET
jgi:hypothetical protein